MLCGFELYSRWVPLNNALTHLLVQFKVDDHVIRDVSKNDFVFSQTLSPSIQVQSICQVGGRFVLELTTEFLETACIQLHNRKEHHSPTRATLKPHEAKQ